MKIIYFFENRLVSNLTELFVKLPEIPCIIHSHLIFPKRNNHGVLYYAMRNNLKRNNHGVVEYAMEII